MVSLFLGTKVVKKSQREIMKMVRNKVNGLFGMRMETLKAGLIIAPPNVKKFIRPHKVIIFLLLILKIILDFLDFHDFWLLFSEPLIYISGILIGIFGAYTYKEFIQALALVSIVAFAIIVYQSPIWTSMSIFINIMRFFDILLVALVINILRVEAGTDYHSGTRKAS